MFLVFFSLFDKYAKEKNLQNKMQITYFLTGTKNIEPRVSCDNVQ